MVDDYLSEQEQWERLTKFLREFWPWIVAGLAAGAVILFGVQWYHNHVDEVALQADAKYQQMAQALTHGDRTQALMLLGQLERDYPDSPYTDQGKLAVARVYIEEEDLTKAAAELQALVDHTKDKDLALIARERLARVQIAQKKPDDALTTLNAAKDPGAFETRYHEVRGDAYFAKGDKPSALKEYRAAKDSPSGMSDTQLLDLKISDLVADASPVTAANTGAAPSSATIPAPTK